MFSAARIVVVDVIVVVVAAAAVEAAHAPLHRLAVRDHHRMGHTVVPVAAVDAVVVEDMREPPQVADVDIVDIVAGGRKMLCWPKVLEDKLLEG